MFLRIQLFSRICHVSTALLSLRSRSGHRFAMVHRHCIQQNFHIPQIQLNMAPEIINTDATSEKMNFILMLSLQALNFSLLYQDIILEFICQHTSKLDVNPNTRKIVAVLFQVQITTEPFVHTRILCRSVGKAHLSRPCRMQH